MTVRTLRRLILLGLGAVAGAVLPMVVAGQEPARRDSSAARDSARGRGGRARAPGTPLPATADTIRIPLPARADSMVRNDSVARGTVGSGERRTVDTIKAPLAQAEAPPALDVGRERIYDRAAFFATGALTLSDLLARVPGLTQFSTGWLVAPNGIASQGNLRGVRLYLDGLELDPMDQREQGRSSVRDLPLHALEEVRIERGADEVRVYARSWRVASTTPFTRADVLTGDQNTNLYRGYFGRRYARGEALQLSAEQGSSQPVNRFPSADVQSFLLRVGVARGAWSTDLAAQRTAHTRDRWVGQGGLAQTLDTIAPLATRRTTAYLRVANGDPDASRWGQLLASAHAFVGNAALSSSDTIVSHDSVTYESQYLLTGGVRRGSARFSAAERVRVAAHEQSATASARASIDLGALSASAFAEGASRSRPSLADVTVRAGALTRLTFLASAARSGGGVFRRVVTSNPPTPTRLLDGSFIGLPLGPLRFDPLGGVVERYEVPARTSARGEVALRVRDLWLGGGFLHRGPGTLLPAAGLGTGYDGAAAIRDEGAATARTASLRGRLWRAVNVDAWAVAWSDTAGLYRPRYQTRTELYLQTSLLDRFPRGNFGLLSSVAHEYRSNARFASGDSIRTVLGTRTLDFKLEIRIQSAVVSYQFRNLLQQRYAQVPGFFLPRQTQLYGVRWEFMN